jgi:hypothetical protein
VAALRKYPISLPAGTTPKRLRIPRLTRIGQRHLQINLFKPAMGFWRMRIAWK